MRLMILGSPGYDADGLAQQVADGCSIPLIRVDHSLWDAPEDLHASLDRALDREEANQGFVLGDAPDTPEQAASLDSVLDALDAGLELVVRIDVASEPLAQRLADVRAGCSPVSEYYRERGLLRRARCEGSPSEVLTTVRRIIDSSADTRHPTPADPFAIMLRAIADSAPAQAGRGRPSGADTPVDTATEKETSVEEGSQTREPTAQGPSWKASAEKKGRILRRSAGAKAGAHGKGKGRRKF